MEMRYKDADEIPAQIKSVFDLQKPYHQTFRIFKMFLKQQDFSS